MTNPYGMSAYPQQQYYPVQNEKSGNKTLPLMTAGFIGGGAVGYYKNRFPIGKDGVVSDSFAKEVFEKNLSKNCSDQTKTYFKQLKNVLKKIDKISTPEGFKKLVSDNKALIDDQCKIISSDTLTDAVNSTNLKESKKALKETLQSIMNFETVKTKNAVKLAWNKESKKFEKTAEFKDGKLFDVIKSTKNNIQWKKALKYGGITAGILGALSIVYKMFTPKT